MARIKYYNKQTSQWEYADNVLASGNQASTPEDIGAVPITRKINDKELSNDITLTAEDVGAAPAGYGLGGYSAWKGIAAVAEIDNIMANGKYCIAQTIGSPLHLEGVAFNSFNLEVSMINQLWGTQTATMLEGYVLRRRCRNGSWEPWEWVVYPLTQGVEYCTTEKLNGSPVYAKLINIGYLASGTHSVAHNCAVSLPLSLDFYNNNQELLNGYSNITNLTVDRTNIHITCGNAFGNITVLMKYTKVGDQ